MNMYRIYKEYKAFRRYIYCIPKTRFRSRNEQPSSPPTPQFLAAKNSYFSK